MPPPLGAEEAYLFSWHLTPHLGLLIVAGAIAGAVHLGKIDASSRVLQEDATRLLYILAGAACGRVGCWPPGRQVHEGFAEHWKVEAAGMDVLRRCLVLIADHELPASTYSARVTASTGASLGACILAALCTFSGRMHGGAIDDVRTLLSDQGVLRDPVQWAVRWRDSGQKPLIVLGFPGFGHRLYPDGDPRAVAILRFLTVDSRVQRCCCRNAGRGRPSTQHRLCPSCRGATPPASNLRRQRFVRNRTRTRWAGLRTRWSKGEAEVRPGQGQSTATNRKQLAGVELSWRDASPWTSQPAARAKSRGKRLHYRLIDRPMARRGDGRINRRTSALRR